MKVYLIFQMYQWSWQTKFDQPQVIYGVRDEKTARKDCIKMQTKHNKEAGNLYKIIYFYKEVKIF